jgi:hypothetical protein
MADLKSVDIGNASTEVRKQGASGSQLTLETIVNCTWLRIRRDPWRVICLLRVSVQGGRKGLGIVASAGAGAGAR